MPRLHWRLGVASSNLTADYCLVYNYYESVANPTGCAPPAQGTEDNGNVVGKYYQDNTDPSYSQAAGYTYDGVNRLMTAVATGNSPFNLTYNYDQYGNGTCVLNGGTQGFCPQYSFNSANNHITNTGYNYDPAGDLLWDGGSNYEYDAEGRVKHSYSTGQWQYPMYNALGQRVQDYQGTDPMTLTYPVDIFGHRTGTFAQWPSHSWTGWNVYWSQVAGQHISMGGADSWLAHSDATDSTTMVTDETGAVVYEAGFDPWGRLVQSGGPRPWFSFAGLQFPVNDPSYPSAKREYNDGLGRWLTPDPDNAGSDVSDSQSWDMYSYVGDNPTTRNDPSGLSYCKRNSSGKIDLSSCVSDMAFPALDSKKGYEHISDVTTEPVTVNGSEATQADLLFALGFGIRKAAPTVNFFGELTMGFVALTMPEVFESSLGLPTAGLGLPKDPAPKVEVPTVSPRPSPPPDLEHLSTKIQDQMASRGWTPQDIVDAYERGDAFQAPNKLRGGTPATRYVNPGTGKSVVIDNTTGEVIHVGKAGYRY